jgi:hypothetical protein
MPCALSCVFLSMCAVLYRYLWFVVVPCPVVLLHDGTMLDGPANHMVYAIGYDLLVGSWLLLSPLWEYLLYIAVFLTITHCYISLSHLLICCL